VVFPLGHQPMVSGMKKFLLVLGFLGLSWAAVADTTIEGPITFSTGLTVNGSTVTTSQAPIPTNAALKALPVTPLGTVVYRAGFSTAGDGGGAYYYPSNAACTLGAGAGDNGYEVAITGDATHCWKLAETPPYRAKIWNVTGAITFYVRTTGNDYGGSNSCLILADPCLTIAQAMLSSQKFYAANGSLTINIGAGSFTESVFVNQPLTGSFNVAGNPNGTNLQPGQLMLSGTGSGSTTITGNATVCGTIVSTNYATVGIRGMTLNGNGNACQSTLFAQIGGTINIYDDIVFGPATVEHIHVENAGSSVQSWYSYTVSGGAVRHILVGGGGGIYLNNAFPSGVITLSGTPAFSDAFVVAAEAGSVQFNTGVSFSGTFTGKRYDVYDNGVIETFPSTSLTWLPGTIAGTARTGGVYHGPAPASIVGAIATTGDGVYAKAGCGDLSSVVCDNSGAWTPALQFNGLSVGLTYSSRVGRYYRLNKMVVVFFDIILTAKGSSTGDAGIAGLPFSSISDTLIACSLGFYANMAGITSMEGSFINAGLTTIALAAPGATDVVALTDANFTNTTRLSGSCTYAAQ
jgi:hypothetical protein